MSMKTKILISIFLIFSISLAGCLGFGEGYVKKGQEITSADYVISQYKFFIDKYNAIRQMGSQIVNAQRNIEDYRIQYGNPEFYTKTQADNYEELRFVKNSYIQQYNKFVTDYNSRMRDITTNQFWMKPQNFPEYVELYIEGKSLVTQETNETLVMPNEIPSPPPGWVPPKT